MAIKRISFEDIGPLNQSHFFDSDSYAEVTRGRNLPHWNQYGKMVFVTFRTADSLPRSVLAALSMTQSDKTKSAYLSLDKYLHQGHGASLMQHQNIRGIVEASIRYHDGVSFLCYGFVIMPNHIHMLILPLQEDVHKAIAAIKRYSAREINIKTGRAGSFWQTECFDTLVRNTAHFSRIREYIADNPRNLAPSSYTLYLPSYPTIR